MKINVLCVALCICAAANAQQSPLLELVKSEHSGISFQNTIRESPQHNHVIWDYVYNGGGVAAGDINNDGLTDLFFTGNQVDDALYLNEGNFKFKNITNNLLKNPPHSWSSGATMADVNGDGWLDIYICRFEPTNDLSKRRNLLFINNKDLTFTESAEAYGLADAGFSVQASFFDMDNDGDLDVYVVNQPPSNNLEKLQERLNPQGCTGYSDKLYQNNGNKTFTDVTIAAGIENCSYGLNVVISDLNNDGWQDIYVSNDYFISDFCYINQKNGKFVNKDKAYFKHQSLYSMGADIADFNNDGFLDIYTVDMSASDHYRNKSNMASMNTGRFQNILDAGNNYQYMFNALQLNNGTENFSEIAQLAGVANTDWSWSALFVDIDNDSKKDIFVTNGIKRDIRFVDGLNKMKKSLETNTIRMSEIINNFPSQKIKNYAFKNEGNYHFKNNADWGFGLESFSNGMAYADLDNDGDLDLIVNNVDETPFLFKNNAQQRFLRLKLEGSAQNKFGYGARATIFYNGSEKQMVELSPTRGYLSSSEPILHFGLGQVEQIDSLELRWPDGKVFKQKNIASNQVLTLNYKDALAENQIIISKKSIFKVYNLATGAFSHQETDFNDFQKEVLLPNKLSQIGPALAVADINKDGLDDYFIGGGANQASQIFIQRANGKFQWQFLNDDPLSETTKALFFDADGDGKLDLYVAHGSNQYPTNSSMLQDMLYMNKNNQFTPNLDALPHMLGSTGAVAACDFDGDGDEDLFVGGMMEQQKYPYPAKSYLLQNKNGKFTDITPLDLAKIGMVRDAIWTDFDKDGDKDLMIVGEWMHITIFENVKGKLSKYNSKSLEKTRGMWHSIKAYDFDGDGDDDYLVGNLGLNNKFKSSNAKKFHVYSCDFDSNGVNDVVLSKEMNGTMLPVRGRECSSQQMPFVAEKFKTYDEFAKATLNEIYTPEKLKSALHYEIDEMGSIYLENLGNGQFQYKLLPMEAQFSVINDFSISDFNGDGKMDVLIVGNKYEVEVETARYDAGVGLLLEGRGAGVFQPILGRESGFSVSENSRLMGNMKIGDKKIIIVGVNGGALKAFEVNPKN
jgi:enediyne biosynthesis protein E4